MSYSSRASEACQESSAETADFRLLFATTRSTKFASATDPLAIGDAKLFIAARGICDETPVSATSTTDAATAESSYARIDDRNPAAARPVASPDALGVYEFAAAMFTV